MHCDEFEFWQKISVKDFAKDLMENHHCSQSKASSEAYESYRLALPHGIKTKNNYFARLSSRGAHVGVHLVKRR